MGAEKSVLIPVPGFTRHGGIRVIVQIANYLSANGWEVTIIGPNFFSNFYAVSDKVKIVTLGPFIKIKLLRWICFCWQLIFFRCGAHVVLATHFVTYWPSKILSLLTGARLLYFVQDVEFVAYRGLRYFLSKPLFISTLRQAKEVIAANQYLSERLSQWIRPEYVFNLGIEDKFIDQSSDRSSREIDVVYFLRHEGYKGLELFDLIAKELRAANLRVMLISQDAELLNKYGDIYGFACISPVNDAALIRQLDNCKLMLLTSSHEGFSLPPLECMSRGVVPVITDCGGPMLYCRNGFNSIVIDSRDPKLFISEIKKLLSDTTLLNLLRENCVLTAKSFRISRGVSRLEIYLNQ